MNIQDAADYTWCGKGLRGYTAIDFHDILKLLKENMDVPFKKSRILDIGCGTGGFTLPLAALGADVLGIDIHSESIEVAKERNTFLNARFEVGNAEELKTTGQFDAVLCLSVLEHLHEPEKLLFSMPKLVKENGIALIHIPNGYGPHEVIGPIIDNLLANKHVAAFSRILAKNFLGYRGTKNYVSPMLNQESPHIQRITYHGIRRILHRNGLTVQCIKGSTCLSGLLPLVIITRKAHFLQRIDALLGRVAPIVASGWHIICKKK